jgi:hypothetical protein
MKCDRCGRAMAYEQFFDGLRLFGVERFSLNFT